MSRDVVKTTNTTHNYKCYTLMFLSQRVQGKKLLNKLLEYNCRLVNVTVMFLSHTV